MTSDLDGLRIDGLTVRFGGLTAVDKLSMEAPVGRITGLIGPNGAGKTTTFNACSGLNDPTEGRLSLFGREITNASPATRASLGMGRTFQRMELFDSLSVMDNVCLGREAAMAGRRPWRHLLSSRHQLGEVKRAADDAIHLAGIRELVDARPADLSTGQRRLVELARTVAGGFRLLLLDEPSSGLDEAETGRFIDTLATLVEETGCGLLVVEHDMALVMRLCQYIYTLDFGRLIFEGSAVETSASDIVRSAYLGDDLDNVGSGT